MNRFLLLTVFLWGCGGSTGGGGSTAGSAGSGSATAGTSAGGTGGATAGTGGGTGGGAGSAVGGTSAGGTGGQAGGAGSESGLHGADLIEEHCTTLAGCRVGVDAEQCQSALLQGTAYGMCGAELDAALQCNLAHRDDLCAGGDIPACADTEAGVLGCVNQIPCAQSAVVGDCDVTCNDGATNVYCVQDSAIEWTCLCADGPNMDSTTTLNACPVNNRAIVEVFCPE